MDEKFPQVIADLKKTLEKIDKNELEPQHRDCFMVEYLPEFVKIIMKLKYSVKD